MVLCLTLARREKVSFRTWKALTSTAEVIVLPAGEPGVFHDLTGIWIYSTTSATRFTIFLRDTNGGDVKFPVALSAGGGSNNTIDRPFCSTIPASVWTAQLNVSPAPDIVYVILQAEKRTANS